MTIGFLRKWRNPTGQAPKVKLPWQTLAASVVNFHLPFAAGSILCNSLLSHDSRNVCSAMVNSKELRTIAPFSQSMGVVIFVAALYVARDILVPLALGGLFAFLLTPLVNRLQRFGLPNVYSVMLTAAGLFCAFGLFLLMMWNGFSVMAAELPKHRETLIAKVQIIQQRVNRFTGKLDSLTVESMPPETSATGEDSSQRNSSEHQDARETQDNSVEPLSAIERWLGVGGRNDAANDGSSPKKPLYVTESPLTSIRLSDWTGGLLTILGPIGTSGLVVVFALFALLYRDDLRDRFTSLVSRGNYVVTSDAIREASQRISSYLIAQTILNVSYGLVFSLGLVAIGFFLAPDGAFPYVALLGLVAGLFRYIPYAGPVVGAIFPLLVAAILFPGYKIFVAVSVLIVVMELISNNVVEPWAYGSSTGVSSVAVILAAVFWGWLWGPIGLLLATPLTVCAVVLGRYVDRFQFLAALLSDEVPIAAWIRGYQRLLAGESHKLIEFFDGELKLRSAPEVLDSVVLPIVKRIRRDRYDQGVDEVELLKQLSAALTSVKLIAPDDETNDDPATDSRQNHDAAENSIDSPSSRFGIAIATASESDSILLKTVCRQLGEDTRMEVIECEELPDRACGRIVSRNPDFVVIGVVPPGGMQQARYWCRALRQSGFEGPVVVACFGKFRNYDTLLVRFRTDGAEWLVTTVNQTISKLKALRIRSAVTSST